MNKWITISELEKIFRFKNFSEAEDWCRKKGLSIEYCGREKMVQLWKVELQCEKNESYKKAIAEYRKANSPKTTLPKIDKIETSDNECEDIIPIPRRFDFSGWNDLEYK